MGSASPSTRTASRSIRCRPTRRPASAWARRPPRPVASARARCAMWAGSSSRPSRGATTTRSSGGWPPKSPTSSRASRCRGCRPRDGAPVTFIEGVGASIGPIVAVFAAAALLAAVLTPVVRRVVLRYRIVDRPNARRVNTRPIPRAGGLAVAAAFLIVAGGFVLLNEGADWVPTPLNLTPADFLALFLGGAAAAALGAIDDLFNLRARWQLAGQIGLALIAVALGIGITVINNPFADAPIRFIEPFSVGFTVFWIVGMINSINWIDGLDGLSTGVALIACVTLGLISLTTKVSQPLIAVLCFAL